MELITTTELQNQYIALSLVNVGRTTGELWFDSCRDRRFISCTKVSPRLWVSPSLLFSGCRW